MRLVCIARSTYSEGLPRPCFVFLRSGLRLRRVEAPAGMRLSDGPAPYSGFATGQVLAKPEAKAPSSWYMSLGSVYALLLG